jgi:hypothetical protein
MDEVHLLKQQPRRRHCPQQALESQKCGPTKLGSSFPSRNPERPGLGRIWEGESCIINLLEKGRRLA